ncbi:MAG TPA: hypothetical protein VI299_21010, partial [Polyangiales bacterium]
MPARWKSLFSGLTWPPLLAAIAGMATGSSTEVGWLALGGWVGALGLCEALFRSPSRVLSVFTGCAFGTLANATGLFSLGPLLISYAYLSAPLAWTVASLTWLAQSAPYAIAGYLTHAIAR